MTLRLVLTGILAFCSSDSTLAIAGDRFGDFFNSSCESAEDCYLAALGTSSLSKMDSLGEDQVHRKVDQLRVLINQYPDSLWAKRGRLLIGFLLRKHQPSQALLYLETARGDFPHLGDYIRYWKAESFAHLGEVSQAATLFESIRKKFPETLLEGRATLRAGQARYGMGKCPEAIVLLRRAVSLDPDGVGVPAALLNVADCQIRAIQPEDGRATLRKVWTQYPDSPESQEAMARLDARARDGTWRPPTKAWLARAEAFFQLAMYDDAVDALNRFLASDIDRSSKNKARLKLGLAYVRLKQYEKARPVYQTLADERGSPSGKAVVWLARIFLRQGDGPSLLDLRDSLSKFSLSSRQRADSLLFIGVWLEDEGKLDGALAAYRDAVRAGRGTSAMLKALWRIGWIQYRTSRFDEAEKTFHRGVQAKDENGWTPQFMYWRARVLEQQQDPRAKEAWARLCRHYPLTYYGQLVRSCEPPSSPGPESKRVKVAPPPLKSDGPLARLKENVHYRKAKELKELGLTQEAMGELAWLARQGHRNRRVLHELSLRLTEVGGHHEALRLVKIYFRDSLEGWRQPASPDFWHVAYPTGYLPIIKSYAENTVDPYLVAAVIREESLYDPNALSKAGAVGLMQIMPSTARVLIGSSDDLIAIKDRLLDSNTNIRLGSSYLGALLDQFSGNMVHAVAAYNAGPHAVSPWIRRMGHVEPAEFVEMIPYRETRRYVKRVLGSYREYHRIDTGGCASGSLDKAC